MNKLFFYDKNLDFRDPSIAKNYRCRTVNVISNGDICGVAVVYFDNFLIILEKDFPNFYTGKLKKINYLTKNKNQEFENETKNFSITIENIFYEKDTFHFTFIRNLGTFTNKLYIAVVSHSKDKFILSSFHIFDGHIYCIDYFQDQYYLVPRENIPYGGIYHSQKLTVYNKKNKNILVLDLDMKNKFYYKRYKNILCFLTYMENEEIFEININEKNEINKIKIFSDYFIFFTLFKLRELESYNKFYYTKENDKICFLYTPNDNESFYKIFYDLKNKKIICESNYHLGQEFDDPEDLTDEYKKTNIDVHYDPDKYEDYYYFIKSKENNSHITKNFKLYKNFIHDLFIKNKNYNLIFSRLLQKEKNQGRIIIYLPGLFFYSSEKSGEMYYLGKWKSTTNMFFMKEERSLVFEIMKIRNRIEKNEENNCFKIGNNLWLHIFELIFEKRNITITIKNDFI